MEACVPRSLKPFALHSSDSLRKRKAKVNEELPSCQRSSGEWLASASAGRLLRCRPVRIPFSIPPASAKPFDVVGFGLNSIDLMSVIAEYPAPNTKQRLQ